MQLNYRRLNMKSKYTLGVFALALIGILGVSYVSAFGFGNGFGNPELSDEERKEMQEQRDAMRNAIDEGNYAEWEVLMQERLAEMEDNINEETFAKIRERHAERSQLREAVEEAKETGDWSEVETLKKELGIEGKQGFGKKGFNKMAACPNLAE